MLKSKTKMSILYTLVILQVIGCCLVIGFNITWILIINTILFIITGMIVLLTSLNPEKNRKEYIQDTINGLFKSNRGYMTEEEVNIVKEYQQSFKNENKI